jgi:hypothetical protein
MSVNVRPGVSDGQQPRRMRHKRAAAAAAMPTDRSTENGAASRHVVVSLLIGTQMPVLRAMPWIRAVAERWGPRLTQTLSPAEIARAAEAATGAFGN